MKRVVLGMLAFGTMLIAVGVTVTITGWLVSQSHADIPSARPVQNPSFVDEPAQPHFHQVADRFDAPAIDPAPQFSEATVESRFPDSAPEFDSPPPVSRFGNRVSDFGSVPPTGLNVADIRNANDVSKRMPYVVLVRQKNSGQPQKRHFQRALGGQVISFVDIVPNDKLPQLRIYAESVEFASRKDGYELNCKGRVVIVANHSMVRGKDLRYAEGAFHISDSQVVTQDATIDANDSSFAFEIASVTINRLAPIETAPEDTDGADGGATVETEPDEFPSLSL